MSPAELDVCALELGLGAPQLGLSGFHLGLVFPGIDDEQEVPFLNYRAGRKVFALEEPGHPSANVDLFDSLGVAGKLQVIDDRLL